jgi:hypothetical protein
MPPTMRGISRCSTLARHKSIGQDLGAFLLSSTYPRGAATNGSATGVPAVAPAPARFSGQAAARAANEAAESLVPTTLIDEAELIWRLCEHHPQAKVGKALGWSREAVRDYLALHKIDIEAWKIIGATFYAAPVKGKKHVAPDDGAMAPSPFSERLLRDIVHLIPAQQRDLVGRLADATIKKPKFTELAKAYAARNAAEAWILAQLRAMDDDYLDEARAAVQSGGERGAPGSIHFVTLIKFLKRVHPICTPKPRKI